MKIKVRYILLVLGLMLIQLTSVAQRDTMVVLKDVVVSSKSAVQRVQLQPIGVERISISELGKVPALFGERDIMRSIQLLPGVKSEGDGSSGYQVRGGTAAQNLVLLDGAPVYNSGHLMGIFSAFNDEALSNATLYKGLVPAQFGGATSSVLDIASKVGNYDKWHYGGTIGLLAAKIQAEGPVNDRLAVMVTARRSYLDAFLAFSPKYKNNTLNFYDINARLNYRASDKDNIFVSLYNARDNMGVEDIADIHWGNLCLTGKWVHFAGSKLTFNTSLISSRFGNDVTVDYSTNSMSLKGHILEETFNENVVWTPSEAHSVTMGVQSQWQQVKSADWWFNTHHEYEQREAWNNDIWLGDDWKISKTLQASAGVRLDLYSTKTDERKTYVNWEPRANMKWCLTDESSIKLGYCRMTQNIHAIRNGSTSLPFDRYTTSTALIKPETADQVSIGYMRSFNHTAYDMSIEGYYKAVDNVYDYMDGKTFTSSVNISDIILGGKGRAYGVELCLRKNLGRLTGWASYTLSWSENKIQGINGGNWYTANNDRRHDINIVGMYELNKTWSFSATFVYNTGQAMSAPSAKYKIDGNMVMYYAERNGYRAPAYHRLDISATNTKKFKSWERQWSFGIYNLYNHYNPYIISYGEDVTKASGMRCSQVSLFGMLPFVSFTIKR